MSESDFLEQHARTRGFSLGTPHTLTIRESPPQVFFLRSAGGDDPDTALWRLDLDSGLETLVLGGAAFERPEGTELAADQVAHQQRAGVHAWARLTAEGITEYTTDAAVGRACFARADGLWAVDLDAPAPKRLTSGACVDPRFDPTGMQIAYVEENSLKVIAREGGEPETLALGESDISWGLPEYIASNMKRFRGYWWSPDGNRIVAARVDTTRVAHWYLGNPADPGTPPAVVVRPTAGGPNAAVTLWVFDLEGNRVEIEWDRDRFEYLVNCSWTEGGLVIAVQSRDQRTVEIRDVDVVSGKTTVRRKLTDPSWVSTFPLLPTVLPGGELLWAGIGEDTHRLFVDDRAITPPGLQLIDVISTGAQIIFMATDEQTETHLWSYADEAGLERLSTAPGVHGGIRAGDTVVVTRDSLVDERPSVMIRRKGEDVAEIASHSEVPLVRLRLTLHRLGPHEIRTALLLPTWWDESMGPLPVLMDPYGGLGLRKVVDAHSTALLISQWFADGGFAVIVADGRGTPGRGPAWERAVHEDIETLPVEDQITALHALAAQYPTALDPTRVAVRGWSWGGYLAAVCVLRRPDVFHAAVVGAAVGDHQLYQSYWKERQLGDPNAFPERYARFSLPGNASLLERPLLIVHGSNDDNVFAAHALRFATALTTAGKPHELLLLAGHGHHAIRLPVSKDVLAYQLGFLRRSLALAPSEARPQSEAEVAL
jgi:dipeptidyl-peptidase 4